jgi:hypothetical protein
MNIALNVLYAKNKVKVNQNESKLKLNPEMRRINNGVGKFFKLYYFINC